MAVDNTIHCDFKLKKRKRKEGGIFENSEKYGKEETVQRNLKMNESLHHHKYL